MSDQRRFIIIIISVIFGILLSAGLIMLRRGGNVTVTDYASLTFNFVFALAIVLVIGIYLNKNKDKIR